MVNLTNTGTQLINKTMMPEKLPKRHIERQRELKWHLTIKAVMVKDKKTNQELLKKQVNIQAHEMKRRKSLMK